MEMDLVPAMVTANDAIAHTTHAYTSEAECPPASLHCVSTPWVGVGCSMQPPRTAWCIPSTCISAAGGTSEAEIWAHLLLCLRRQQRVQQLKR